MLVLSVLRCPDTVPPETRRVAGGEFKIGRGPDNDWIMPDPDRLLSKRHCVIAFRNGGWALADTSTNGTFINRDVEPLGAGKIRELANGDHPFRRLRDRGADRGGGFRASAPPRRFAVRRSVRQRRVRGKAGAAGDIHRLGLRQRSAVRRAAAAARCGDARPLRSAGAADRRGFFCRSNRAGPLAVVRRRLQAAAAGAEGDPGCRVGP